MCNLIRLCLLVFTAVYGVSCSRVLELSDRFIDISHEGMWFVKFYAPWCAHCRRIEPIWAHVAQSLYNSQIKVAKVDCTRFPAVATHFKVRAYPTILFIKGSQHHEYNGERMKDDMVNYAVRMSQPAVQRLTQADSLGYLKEAHPVFFGFIGKQQGALWDMFVMHADKYQPHSWFYAMSHETVRNDITPPNDSAVFCYKEDDAYFFDAQPVIGDTEALNNTLDKWINAERFGFFPKITRSNIHHLMDTEKYIVIAVVSENKLSEITQAERDFKDMVEGIIRFTCCSYDGQTEHINVNEVRKDLFASKNKLVISLPPTSAALYKHALRAAYKAGHIWGNALKIEVSIPCPSSWGWTKEKESWTPEWSAVKAIWSQLSLLDHCGCKSGCETMRCGCRRVSLPCTAQCKSCKGGCTNQKKKKNTLHSRFQFGWMGSLDLANSIAMSDLSAPQLLVLNSTTSHHHMPDDDPVLMTPEAVLVFLDQIHNQLAPTYGGNSWWVRVYRALYEARTTLASMWRGNPVLTALVFGLPLGFLSLICYSVCCADILDADEEEIPETHEKKD